MKGFLGAVTIILLLQGCSIPFIGNNTNGNFRSSSANKNLQANQDNQAKFTGQIAFSDKYNIYILNGKDGSIKQVTNSGDDLQPAFSPDGSSIAYIHKGTDFSNLMTIPASGGTSKVLVNDDFGTKDVSSNYWISQPIWSPDGTLIYAPSDRGKYIAPFCQPLLDFAIFQFNVSNPTHRSVVTWPDHCYAGGDQDIQYRPDNADGQLIYTEYGYTNDDQLSVALHLYDLKTKKDTLLTPEDANQQVLQPSWSPDGNFVAYIKREQGQDNLYVMPSGGTTNTPQFNASQKLLSGMIAQPIWSPDGTEIAYIAFNNGTFNLWLAHITNTNGQITLSGTPIQLTNGGIDADSRPSWTAS